MKSDLAAKEGDTIKKKQIAIEKKVKEKLESKRRKAQFSEVEIERKKEK